MPILYNKETDLAERLPGAEHLNSLASGSHEVYLVGQDGEIITAPQEEARRLLSEGYRHPNKEEFKNLLDYANFSSPTEQFKTFAQNVGKTASFGATTAAQIAAGDTLENIKQRDEINPLTATAGEVGGLLVPGGAGSLITKAGAGAAKALGLGLEGSSYLNKVGGYAARNAVEGALIAGEDEASKAFAKDPEQTLGSAVSHMGLTGLVGGVLGGGFGSLHPIWSASSKNQLGSVLGAIKDKANGVSGANEPFIKASGMDLAPEIKAVLQDNPKFKQWFQTLMQNDSSAGRGVQQAYSEFKKEASKEVLNAVEKSPSFIEKIQSLSPSQAGEEIRASIISELEPVLKEIQDGYDPVSGKFSKVPLPEIKGHYGEIKYSAINEIADKIGSLAEKEGYLKYPKSPQMKVVNEVLSDLPLQKNLEDLRTLSANIGKNTSTLQTPELWSIGRQIRNTIKDESSKILRSMVEKDAPHLLSQLEASNIKYGNLSRTIDALNDELRVGKYAGPRSFIEKFKSMTGEDVLKAMAPKNNARFLDLLQTQFPKTSDLVKQSILNQTLKESIKGAEGDLLKTSAFFDRVFNQWSPELRNFVLPPGAAEKLDAIRVLLDGVPKDRISQTGSLKDSLNKHMAGGVLAAVSYLTGKNPFGGYLLGSLGRLVSQEGKDYVKVGLLKFLGSDKPINAGAFKTMVDFAHAAAQGQNKITNGVQELFKKGSGVIVQNATKEDTEKLQKSLDVLQSDPKRMFDIGGDLTHYVSEQGMPIGSLAVVATQYLDNLKPKPSKSNLLDDELKPSKEQQANYERQLGIAADPSTILNFLRDGTITNQDVTTVKTLYPGLYKTLSEELMSNILKAQNEKVLIPYGLKLSMSRFLGQPLDSTMTPQSIMAAQPKPGAPVPSQQQKPPSAASMKGLQKLPGMNQTGIQSRELHRSNK